jgi:transcriptional regulator with XRE-family HTH domain
MISETSMAETFRGRAGMPYADMPLAQYISKQVDVQVSMGKNQRQIAQEIGYDKPNMISMFKRGEAKVPLDKIPALAKALNVDPAYMFRLAIQQYWPDMHKAVAQIFGTVLTRNETKMIDVIRRATKGTDPEVTDNLERKLKVAFRHSPVCRPHS